MKREKCITIPRPIAITIDYRGKDDNHLTFLFRGVSWAQLVSTFTFLIGKGYGIAQDAILYLDNDIVSRKGKGSFYYAVELIEPNLWFSSLDDMKILIESQLIKHGCNVTWFKMEKFLNI